MIWRDSAQVDEIRRDSALSGAIPRDAARFKRFSAIHRSSARFGTIRCDSTRFGSHRFLELWFSRGDFYSSAGFGSLALRMEARPARGFNNGRSMFGISLDQEIV